MIAHHCRGSSHASGPLLCWAGTNPLHESRSSLPLALVFPVLSINASEINLCRTCQSTFYMSPQTQDDKATVHSMASLSRDMGRYRRNRRAPQEPSASTRRRFDARALQSAGRFGTRTSGLGVRTCAVFKSDLKICSGSTNRIP
jgi:hypothetical protein